MAVASAMAAAAGCSPALDWRDVALEGTPARIEMPCRPDRQTRRVMLAGTPVEWSVAVCQAGGLTWALAGADLREPARVGPALAALREGLLANLGRPVEQVMPLTVPGATPNPLSQRAQAQGRRPDGETLQVQYALVVRGTAVWQATVLGPALQREAADAFMESLRVGR